MNNEELNKLIEKINKIIESDYGMYLTDKKINTLLDELNQIKKSILTTKPNFFEIINLFFKNNKIKNKIRLIKNNKENINNNYLKKLKEKTPINLKTINSKLLDDNQLDSILIDEENVLVIAGAGTGKTTTIIGKIKYLLINERVNPEEILLLTYTKNAAEEMKKRIHSETNMNLDVCTFHKFGRDIISSVEGKSPTLTNINLNKLIMGAVSDLIKTDDQYKIKLINYLLCNQYLYKTQFDYNDISSYEEYIKNNPFTTLKNQKVKSHEELVIANFLTLNGIDYEYEKKYIVDTSNLKYSQYCPDFYLPKYEIWIEHFGINRNGDVPSFFKGKDNKTAKEVYNEGIKWKRKTHKENKTKLIETFSYENKEGILLSNLEKKLKQNKVEFIKVDYSKIAEDFMRENRSMMNGLIELFSTVINLLKINRVDEEKFNEIDMNISESELRSLIMPIFKIYEKTLKDFNEIDYSDMLNKAIDYIKDEKYKNKYKYVVVDEYQDMSKVTYELLKFLRESSDYKLYAVGDDWQSIYRFAGSDIEYITKFDKYFGSVERFFIPNTYRYSQSISNLAGDFIMKNPNQISKKINSSKNDESFDIGLIEGYSRDMTMKLLEENLNDLPFDSEVLFLSRYNNDINYLNNSFEIKRETNNTVKVIYTNRIDLNIKFRSIHSAKGLEADYVFILNNQNGNYGFPSTIQDNSIISYFLSSEVSYFFSEERRLMYVALTRAKKKVWLVASKKNQSAFIYELKNKYSKYFNKENLSCPNCNGYLTKKKGSFGEFLGCSNYPDCKYTKKIK